MLKLKSILKEGYAWERKADGSLPTLKDAIAVHEANEAKKEPRWQDSDGDGKWYEKGDDVKEVTEAVGDGNILDLVSRAEDMVQNLRRNMATNSVLQREEKMGYLRAYDELLDVLSDIGYQAEMSESITESDEPGDKQYNYDDPDGIDFDDENFSDPFIDDPKFMDETAESKSDFSEYSIDALTDMKVNLSRFEGNEEEIAKINQELAKRRNKKNESKIIKKGGLQEMREIPLEQRILRNFKGNDYILQETFKRK